MNDAMVEEPGGLMACSPRMAEALGISLELEDPLYLLPRTSVLEYKKNEIIYELGGSGETALYLVIRGRVKVSQITDGGKEVILDFCRRDDFFGETGLLYPNRPDEKARAMDNETSLISWTAKELRMLMLQKPALGPSLLSIMAQKLVRANKRTESLCLDPINRRLVKTLLNLGRRFSEITEKNLTIHMPPFTHESLAQYIGTSREIVTQYLNQFRRDNLLRYSRHGITVNVLALEQYLSDTR